MGERELLGDARGVAADGLALFARVMSNWLRDRYIELSPRYLAQTRSRLDEREFVRELGLLVIPTALARKNSKFRADTAVTPAKMPELPKPRRGRSIAQRLRHKGSPEGRTVVGDIPVYNVVMPLFFF